MGDWFNIGAELIDTAGNAIQNTVQYSRQKKLMEIQQQNQMELNKQGQQIQLETWEKTNYPAQVEMLKKAGLNPALLYSKGGAGGTTGGQGGGSASGGNAPTAQPMNISNILALKQMEASIKLAEAQANKTNKEADVIGTTGIKEAESRISKIIAETANTELQGELIKVQTEMERIHTANRQYQIDAEVNNVIEQTNKLKLENKLTTETFSSIVRETAERAIGQTLQNQLTEEKTKLTQQEFKAIQTGIVQKWTELSQRQKSIDINEFEAEIRAEYPTAGQLIGSIAKKAYKSLKNLENAIRGNIEPIRDEVK